MKNIIENFNPSLEQEFIDKETMLNFIEKYDNYLDRSNNIGHFTVSAWITNKEKNKVLMIYHNIYNSWSFVGGHLDNNSDVLLKLKEEINEETGLKNIEIDNNLLSVSSISVDPHFKHNKYVPSHLHFDLEYLVYADPNDLIRIKEDENSNIKWFDIDEVLNYVNEPKMIPIYQKFINKIKKS